MFIPVLAVNTTGSVMVTLDALVQTFASEPVTGYVPVTTLCGCSVC